MTAVRVGLDVGGTKTAVIVETVDGERLVDTELASEGWDAEPVAQGVAWVLDAVRSVLPEGHDLAAIGIGAQGLDTAELAHEFAAALGVPALAVNDAALLVPAAGLDAGIGVISGTGAIAVGADADGHPLITGGWGWVIGDEAGAAGIVREAAKAALLAHDDGEPDDGLLTALLGAFGVADAERLARAVNDEPTMDNWGPRAPAVFAAADAGSHLATTVIAAAADHLVTLVNQLVRRGATGTDVVIAGSVILNQPRLEDAFKTGLAIAQPQLTLHRLDRNPVEGAIVLARRAQAHPQL